MAGFTYRLYLENGEDIGTFTTAVLDWDVGMEFVSSDHVTSKSLDIVRELGGGEFGGAFIVTPVELAEP